MNTEFLDTTFMDNSLRQYLWLGGAVLFAIIFKKYISKGIGLLLYRLFKKYFKEGSVNVFISLLLKPVEYFVVILTIYIAIVFLKFPDSINFNFHGYELKMIVFRLMHLVLVISVIWIALRIIDFIARILAQRAAEMKIKLDEQLVPFIKDFLKIITVIIGIFFILGAIFKFNIIALLAGAGFMGLAVALAAKDSMENLFASFIIFIDKPFTVGDVVKTGEVTGTVENVGFRSTRIRTVEKTFLTIPNSKIVNSTLDNISLQTFRKVEFKIGLTYQTSLEQIKAIVKEIHQSIYDQPKTSKPDLQVTFHELGETALLIRVLYFVEQMPFNDFLKIREEINFKIMEIVKRHNAEFAFPVRTAL